MSSGVVVLVRLLASLQGYSVMASLTVLTIRMRLTALRHVEPVNSAVLRDGASLWHAPVMAAGTVMVERMRKNVVSIIYFIYYTDI